MIYNAYYSRESSIDFFDVSAVIENENIHCGALAAMSMHFARFIRDVKPRYICAALDASSKTFRNDLSDLSTSLRVSSCILYQK